MKKELEIFKRLEKTKKINFYIKEREYVQFFLFLRSCNLYPGQFFRWIIKSVINQNPDFLKWIENKKEEDIVEERKPEKTFLKDLKKEHEEMMDVNKDFGLEELSDEDIENIFSVLESELYEENEMF